MAVPIQLGVFLTLREAVEWLELGHAYEQIARHPREALAADRASRNKREHTRNRGKLPFTPLLFLCRIRQSPHANPVYCVRRATTWMASMPIARIFGRRWQLPFLWPCSASNLAQPRRTRGETVPRRLGVWQPAAFEHCPRDCCHCPGSQDHLVPVAVCAADAGSHGRNVYRFGIHLSGTLADPAQPGPAGTATFADHRFEHLCPTAYLAKTIGGARWDSCD